jgi:hypothetical protein
MTDVNTGGWFWYGNSCLNENIKLHYKFLSNTLSTLFLSNTLSTLSFNFKTSDNLWQYEIADTIIHSNVFLTPVIVCVQHISSWCINLILNKVRLTALKYLSS